MFLRALARPRFHICLLAALLVSACLERETLMPSAPVTDATPVVTEDPAAVLIARGDFAGLAAHYAAIAGDDPELRLKGLLVAQDLGQAGPKSDLGVDAGTSARARLLQAMRWQHAGADDQAFRSLDTLIARGFDRYEQGLFLRTFGKAQQRRGDPAALVNLLNAERHPLPAARRTELTHLVWEALQSAEKPPAGVREDNPNLAGWWALRAATRNATPAPDALETALATWRSQYPGHPAQQFLVDALLESQEAVATPPTRIALILPGRGPLFELGRAVRDGFISANLAQPSPRVAVDIFEGEGANTPKVYREAVARGAGLVVGPLDKPGTDALAAMAERPVPVLALNTVTARSPKGTVPAVVPGLTQFGLLPEDEAMDLAQRAWADGHRRVAALFPETALGARVRAAFLDAWETLGGQVVVESRYGQTADDYKAAIRRSFALDESERRAASLVRILRRPVISESRPRPDLDAIVLAADPVSARQIIPQFRYLDVAHLPIYATAQIHDGTANPQADADLDGVIFAVRPFDLDPANNPSRMLFDRYWQGADAGTRQLFAFGLDAYALAGELGALQQDPARALMGQTGRLTRDQSGRIHRAFAWARFEGGVPRPRVP